MSVYEPAYQEFLRRLKAARNDAGLTQVQVGNLLGKPHSFVSKCEMGERRVDFVEALRFAKLYRKSLRYFMQNLAL